MRGTCAPARRASKVIRLGRQRDRLETFAVRERSLRRTRRPDVRSHVRPRLYPRPRDVRYHVRPRFTPRPRSRPRPHLYPRPGGVATGFVDENLRKLLLLVAHVRVRPRLRLANPRAAHAARRRSDHRRDDHRDDGRPNTRRALVAARRAASAPDAGVRLRREHERGEFGRKTPSTFGGEAPSARFEPGSSSIPKARATMEKTTVLSNARSPRSPGSAAASSPATASASTPSDPTSRAPSRRNAGPRAANTARISAASLSYPCVPRYVPIFSPHAE